MAIRIGIPRALAYYSFFPQWKTFFEELGAEVVLSPPTNKHIVNEGIRDTVTDACIPIKVYHGHVASLADKADYLFVPRIAGLDADATLCPKFLGLPEMIRASVKGIPPLLSPRLDVRDGRFHACQGLDQDSQSPGSRIPAGAQCLPEVGKSRTVLRRTARQQNSAGGGHAARRQVDGIPKK